MRRVAAVLISLGLLLGTAAPAVARSRFPRHLDPRSWELPEHMTWSDYKDIPGVDWAEGDADPPKTLRAALILGDFQDQGFRVAETSVDPTGQRGLGVDDAAQYWLDYLFYDTDPTAPQRGHTVDEYWLENSYGLIGVDAEAFGPYTMEGNMYEYGVRDFGGDADCPDGPDGCQGDFDSELVAASLADVTLSQQEHGEFDFRFLLHAGYDESGVWLNYGQAMFDAMEAVTDPFGPSDPDHRNWATTRYVPWTSFFAAQQIWSHALPGALSTQGESDGGSTYAHELSHILGVLDNYNNPYAENPDRAYSGPWDMMSRGTFNGPGGPFERNQIPPTQGGTMGSHHMLRNKIRMGFIPATEALTLTQSALDAAGVVRARVMQRETPPITDDPEMYSGIRIQLTSDRSSCDSSEPRCDGGGYDFYDVEVVNRQGFDSFVPDHGVLIAKSKAADASPFIWVIDAFPKDIGGIDYVTADGTQVPYTVGDYRQLADATFHAGTARRTRNSYFDRDNDLAFYILQKRPEGGHLTYSIAVQSLSSPNQPTPAEVQKVSGRLVRNEVEPIVFKVTNPGATPGVYRLKVIKQGDLRARLLNDLIYLDGGTSKNVRVWAKKTGRKAKVNLEAVVASDAR
jgi:M6 family metalloprotease-like protein